jgi:hypothetical protein
VAGPLGLKAKEGPADGRGSGGGGGGSGGGGGGGPAGGTAVLIGPIGKGIPTVKDFYGGCTLEVIGPGSIKISAVDAFTTLGDLCDKMLARAEGSFVIVNHGNPDQGLIVKFTATSPHNATGLMIDDLASLSKVAGSLRSSDPRVIDAAAKMGVTAEDALQLIKKLAQLHAKQRLLFFRGCNIGKNPTMLASYKAAFGAAGAQAPNCRMFYLRINPARPPRGQTMAGLSKSKPLTPKTRRRTFTDSTSRLGPLIIDVRDLDGHTHVESHSFADDPAQAAQWGAKILPEWRSGTGRNDEFVAEVLWDDAESSYMTPLEPSYRARLVLA